jgi:PIN domain nuclease of toxin-antitoxin system
MILLDTNAVVWLLTGHPRAAPLIATTERLFLSPVTLLELAFLAEVGRVRSAPGVSVEALAEDPRWQLDDPSSSTLFMAALDLDWTRDPFDRLTVAHARYRRWRLATGDRRLLAHLPAAVALAL